MSKITGGFYLKARCVQQSWISQAPPHVREIWDWILMNANYKDHGNVKRGQLLTTYRDIQEGLAWFIGYRKETYKKHHCEIAMKALTREHMIATAKTTRGIIITVLNYDKYQDPKHYECYSENDNAATRLLQPTDTIRKERNTEERNKKPSSSEQPDEANADDLGNDDDKKFYKAKSGKRLTGSLLTDFDDFWDAFNYKSGRASAADSFIANYKPSLKAQIIAAAKAEAARRPELRRQNRTPKMAQGWLSERRWEDEDVTQAPSISELNCEICDYKCRGTCPGGREKCQSFRQVAN